MANPRIGCLFYKGCKKVISVYAMQEDRACQSDCRSYVSIKGVIKKFIPDDQKEDFSKLVYGKNFSSIVYEEDLEEM